MLVTLWHAVPLGVIGRRGGGLRSSSVVTATAAGATGTTTLLQSAALARLSNKQMTLLILGFLRISNCLTPRTFTTRWDIVILHTEKIV